MEIRELDSPADAATHFLEANNVNMKWKDKLVSTIE